MKTKLYQALAQTIQARTNCSKTNNSTWFNTHTDHIQTLVKNNLPSGSGFDKGTKIDLERSTHNKLVFYTSFHHMNDSGYYDGWTEYTIFVTPDLAHNFNLEIKGPNRNDIKDYIAQLFYDVLEKEI